MTPRRVLLVIVVNVLLEQKFFTLASVLALVCIEESSLAFRLHT